MDDERGIHLICLDIDRANRQSPAMMNARSSLMTAIFLVCFWGTAALANPIIGNPFFKQLVGKWQGEGELANSENGSKTPVKETWEGKFTDSGNFVISGKRLLDQGEHDFAWEYFANGDLIEGQMKMSEPELDIRFEAQVSEAFRTITMKIPLSGGGGTLTITNTVSEDGQTIEGSVEIVDTAGRTTSTGKVTHRKQ
ncbi:MAG TPA: hypothetical protein PK529_06960 [Verrucomicrobiales bacterium]|nr:hypothetical protein [Verrucomicrobiales bacterium]